MKCFVEEDGLSEIAVWPTLFLFNVTTALEGTHNYIFICWQTKSAHVGSKVHLTAF